ncbi:MAG: hypothetical protein QM493_04865 [Sulfurovum sp.]
MQILWLDDNLDSIEYELELIRESNTSINIETFENINELLGYLDNDIDENETIFIIDIMLINEDSIVFKEVNANIPIDLMAGVILYEECLNRYFPLTPTILYTSRGGDDQDIFKRVRRDNRFDKTLFVIGKEELETNLKDTLKALGVKVWE